ncbi:hypothetical protein ACVWZ4_004333 [Bradyrhizobium sp. USDA 4472]
MSKSELHTVAAETTEVIIPLADENGVGLEGVRLRLSAWAYRRQHDVTATLEVAGGRRSFVNISRIDAWPADPHFNTIARKTAGLGHVPPVVEHCHIHRFEDNAKVGGIAFLPPHNLPIAVPFSEPLTSFRSFLRMVAQEFNIQGLDDFPAPPWQEYLL